MHTPAQLAKKARQRRAARNLEKITSLAAQSRQERGERKPGREDDMESLLLLKETALIRQQSDYLDAMFMALRGEPAGTICRASTKKNAEEPVAA